MRSIVCPLESDFTELHGRAARLRVVSSMVATTTACGSCTRLRLWEEREQGTNAKKKRKREYMFDRRPDNEGRHAALKRNLGEKRGKGIQPGSRRRSDRDDADEAIRGQGKNDGAVGLRVAIVVKIMMQHMMSRGAHLLDAGGR
jgi:hypothetical protein